MTNKHYVDPNFDFGRFAEKKELEEDYQIIKYGTAENSHPNNAAGLGIEIKYDSENNITGALVDGGDTNTIIVSATGSGKTRITLSQYILSCIYAKHNFIVHDPKGELYLFFYNLLKQNGFNIRVLNFREPMKGDRYNFLEEAATLWKKGKKGRAIEMVREYAHMLYSPIEDSSDKFWTQTSINLFLCYFTIAADLLDAEYVTLSAIHRIHVEGLQPFAHDVFPIKSKMKVYLEQHRDEICYELGMPSISAPNETAQSIFSVFANGIMRAVSNDDIIDMTTKSSFKASEFANGKRPTALFIITRDEAPQAYSTLVSICISSIYQTLIDLAQSKCKNNRLPIPVHFILEEFGNISMLENINDMLTASRSRGIRIVLAVQSLCQLSLIYKRELAEILIGNSQNLVYMSSTDMTLVKMISERCGMVRDEFTNEIKPLLSPDKLMHFDKKSGETLMLLGRHYPYITHLPDISEYKMIKPLEKMNIKTRKRIEIKRNILDSAFCQSRSLFSYDDDEEKEEYPSQNSEADTIELLDKTIGLLDEMIEKMDD